MFQFSGIEWVEPRCGYRRVRVAVGMKYINLYCWHPYAAHVVSLSSVTALYCHYYYYYYYDVAGLFKLYYIEISIIYLFDQDIYRLYKGLFHMLSLI